MLQKIMDDLSPEQRAAVEIVKTALDCYNSKEGTGLFTGASRYDILATRMAIAAAQVQYIELPAPGMWQAYEKFGVHDNDTTEGRAATAWFDRQFNTAFEAVEVAGHIVGMRAGESQRRTWNILKRGVHYQRQDGRRMLLPLAGWSGKDVWAYTATHGLPYLHIYDHATYDRDRQRSEIAMSNPGSQRLHAHGEFQAWQMCYPAEFQAWCDRWPELAYS